MRAENEKAFLMQTLRRDLLIRAVLAASTPAVAFLSVHELRLVFTSLKGCEQAGKKPAAADVPRKLRSHAEGLSSLQTPDL